MAIRIREVEKNDVTAVLSLMREFAAYEHLSEYCTVTEARLTSAMFGEGSFVNGLIALDEEKPVAYALYFPSFSTFRGERGVFLEDIYISKEYRAVTT